MIMDWIFSEIRIIQLIFIVITVHSSIDYTYSSTPYSIASDTWDLWINGNIEG